MIQSQFSRFAELMTDDLPKLCREKRTGMLFIASSDNRLAQFGLDQGEIVFLAFQNKRGLEALSSLKGQNFKVSVCRFSEGRALPNRMALPATADILKQLSVGEQHRPATATDPASARVQPTAPDPVSGRVRPTTDPVSGRVRPTTDPVSGRVLSDQVKTVLNQELAELMGPMAAIVCEETWASVGSLAQALDALSRELPDPKQAARFQQNVLRRLMP
jgi:hypothetical protein